MHTLDYWSWFMSKYNPWDTDSDNEGWSSFFGTVIKGMLPKFVKWGPEALCVAASHGCYLAVKELLDRSNDDAQLRHALFEDRGRDGKHQSVGVAAHQGHLDILTLLCEQQPAVAAHLRHRGPGGETAFHAATAMVASRFEPAVVAALVDAWPEGADLPGDHTTPLHTLAMCDTGEDGYVEAARTLLATGRVDANFVTEEGSGALVEAVSRGREAMVEVLVKEGEQV
ncbi:putative wd-repeat protein [Neofusicoccum parvum UCRNP2]|uniref:Putative wd-repeat protein n=1 Tax=Botryosphaeria parva (strain UCR-NP2) TaxID=1287680 RepID=R1GKJ3_BOTPV|nr:putative wd-repeat protein [Neofusicoccum parvum UCRNP2]